MSERNTHITRRTMIQSSVAAATTPLILRSSALGAPSDRLNIAAVGVGGKGRSDIEKTSVGQNVVAICDVDARMLAEAEKKYPGAKVYTDWRKLLEQKDIDAVTVSTPDHMHAPVAISAMQLGKHVYVQKPLAHTVNEARLMRTVASKQGVVTQMGNQGHSGSGYRTVVQLIQNGSIGKVKEAHAWSNRPIWPQGIGRPKGSDPVPEWLDWDKWIGAAPMRPYLGPQPGSKRNRGVYHPFNWRGWLDFGVGALGDMGCHIIDPVVWSLELEAPLRFWAEGKRPNGETFPKASVIHYEFPKTKHTAGETIRVTWHDGGNKPSEDLVPLPDGEKIPDNGCLLIGEKGVLLCRHGGNPMLLPQDDFRDHKIELVEEDDHYLQWTNACKGNGSATSNFDYSGPLTETVLLGTVAVRFAGEKLEWDAKSGKVTNHKKANATLTKNYRKGWEIA